MHASLPNHLYRPKPQLYLALTGHSITGRWLSVLLPCQTDLLHPRNENGFVNFAGRVSKDGEFAAMPAASPTLSVSDTHMHGALCRWYSYRCQGVAAKAARFTRHRDMSLPSFWWVCFRRRFYSQFLVHTLSIYIFIYVSGFHLIQWLYILTWFRHNRNPQTNNFAIASFVLSTVNNRVLSCT